MFDGHKTKLVPSSEPQKFPEQIEKNCVSKQGQFGVEGQLTDIPGITTLMLYPLDEHGIRSIEDLADCATDDLVGWYEFKDGQTIRHAGILDSYRVSRKDCETIIINARTKAGWFK